ncbi:hypothetical protein [Bacillus sp. SLBN-3]
MQRRVADSCGKRGEVETLEAQPKRLNSLPAGKRPSAAERNTLITTTTSLQGQDDDSLHQISTSPLLRTECSAAEASRLLWEKRAR